VVRARKGDYVGQKKREVGSVTEVEKRKRLLVEKEKRTDSCSQKGDPS